MERPIVGLETTGFGATRKDDGGVGFGNEYYSSETGSGSHDESDPLCPPPTERRLRDKAASNRTYGRDDISYDQDIDGARHTCDRTDEGGCRKYRYRNATINGVPDIC